MQRNDSPSIETWDERRSSELRPCARKRETRQPRSTYLELSERAFEEKIERGREILSSCVLCARRCGVNRLEGEEGYCRSGPGLKLASVNIHRGEEPPISGTNGSGTLFFSHCTLSCVFCQNYPVSQLGTGRVFSPEKLAEEMLGLQKKGAHNINLVTPTHQVPSLLEALQRARASGLTVPLVYNTGGYDSPECLALLDGVIDIYLPDMKYASAEHALRYSSAPDYPRANRLAVREMFRQAGQLETDGNGVALRGVIIRHLVLPSSIAGTEDVLRFVAAHFGRRAAVSLMGQYFPAFRAHELPEISRKLTRIEYRKALQLLDRFRLTRGWYQKDR
jgi:putative pyruvate formate lyase activating enzyme